MEVVTARITNHSSFDFNLTHYFPDWKMSEIADPPKLLTAEGGIAEMGGWGHISARATLEYQSTTGGISFYISIHATFFAFPSKEFSCVHKVSPDKMINVYVKQNERGARYTYDITLKDWPE